MKTSKTCLQMLLAISMCACSSGGDSGEPDTPDPTPPTQKQLKINLNTTVEKPGSTADDSRSATRVTDYAFEQGDRAGLYVVNRKVDGSAAALAVQGNHVDNMRFTYNGTWTPDTPIYWSNDTTHADFYLYYPYTAELATISAVPFNLKADQSTKAAYKSCDVLTGTAMDIAPTDQTVTINARHIMSKIQIILVAGNGFTEESLSKSAISVKINNIKLQSTVNIATGEVTATGSATTLTPLKTEEGYTALLPPQSVAEGNLITITIDGRAFNLSKAFTFKSSTRHKFTVKVSKTSNGMNVDITKWEDDGTDNGGTAE